MTQKLYWRIESLPQFDKQLDRLPTQIQRKFEKQLRFLQSDFNYPSLRIKRMSGTGLWEARVDYHYRFIFVTDGDLITLMSIGMHDEGLGKK